MVKVKESVDWAALKKSLTVAYLEKDSESGQLVPFVVTGDGEIVPGITVTEQPDVFRVEVKA